MNEAQHIAPEIDSISPVLEFSKENFESQKPLLIQPKLSVGAADDPFEHEADAIADRVMRMPDSSFIQRKCASCEHEEEQIHRKITPFIQKQGNGLEGGTASESVTNQINSSRGEGNRMSENTLSFMESRFNTDFSGVKIHTDTNAVQMSRELNAQAFTVGSDIYFNEGKYSPESASGKHLLAHELTHTVQQGGGIERKIQRRETNPSMWGLLFGGSRNSQDWYFGDRMAWQQASVSGSPSTLSQSNSFIMAAIYNTQNLLPGEYTNIEQRHDYYDLISYVIEHDPNTPAAARGVRFFHATTLVTGSPGIGTVDSPLGAVVLQRDTRVILREVNADLFAANMAIIRNLLLNWREPRSPSNPTTQITAFDFDIQMVSFEQARVEQYLITNRSRFTGNVIQDINDTLDPNAFGQSFNPSSTPFQWAIQALGLTRLDFTNSQHRVAIGRASVHIFHRRTLQQYLTFMQQNP
jgi:Domain of unknown function (DUF4157)